MNWFQQFLNHQSPKFSAHLITSFQFITSCFTFIGQVSHSACAYIILIFHFSMKTPSTFALLYREVLSNVFDLTHAITAESQLPSTSMCLARNKTSMFSSSAALAITWSSLSATARRDVVLGLGPWSLVVLKDKIAVLGPGLGLEPSVLGPVLGLACWVLGPGLGLEG